MSSPVSLFLGCPALELARGGIADLHCGGPVADILVIYAESPPEIPVGTLTWDGVPLTWDGEYLTWQS